MAVAQTVLREEIPSRSGPLGRGPFGLPWLPAVVLCELLYILCRGGAQGYVRIDDPTYWLVGLVPFALQLIGERVFSARSSSLVEVWISSLAAFLTFQFFDLAHFIEFPINLRLDVGLVRNLATSAIYVGLGLVCMSGFLVFMRNRKARATSCLIAALTIIPVIALVLFQAF